MRECQACHESPETVEVPAGVRYLYYFNGGHDYGSDSYWSRGQKVQSFLDNVLKEPVHYCPRCCESLGIEWQTLIKS